MNVEVSLGEAIDKLNILELKLKKISNEEKCKEIKKEIHALNACEIYKQKYSFFYHLLTYVNEDIWDTTDLIKNTQVTDPLFPILSNKIFVFNQKRFRVKSWFNMLESSNIKEQKSYASTIIQINVTVEEMYGKIAEINYLLLEYDIVYVDPLMIEPMKKIFKQPNLFQGSCSNSIEISSFTIDSNVFEYPPLNYISGGMLGDFIHQLSIINETFMETGRKGNLYISETVGDVFRFGIETAYNDTYEMIKQQQYINDYKLFNGEPIDINLSQWRTSPLLYTTTWYNIFKDVYQVDWAKHPWLILPQNDTWKDRVIINYTLYRGQNFDFQDLYVKYDKKLVFMAFDKEAYNELPIQIDYYCPTSLYEFAVAINSCELFIGGLSSPLTFAIACHKKYIVGLNERPDSVHFL
jgi:hypothetical protein